MSQDVFQELTIINNKLDAHNTRFDEHDRRFEVIDKRFEAVDKRFDAIDARLDAHEQLLNEHTEQIDYIARTVADHTVRLDRIESTMVTKTDLAQALAPITRTLDYLVGLVEKRDQEMVLMNHAIQRIEKHVGLA